jgi:hypothetical protein
LRAIGVSFGFSKAVSIFGGLAPLVATWLIAQTGDSLSPSVGGILILWSLAIEQATDNRSRRSSGAALKGSWPRLRDTY